MNLFETKEYEHINTIQCIAETDKILYEFDYNELTDYLRGVRDTFNMINQLEEPREIAKYIINECKKLKK